VSARDTKLSDYTSVITVEKVAANFLFHWFSDKVPFVDDVEHVADTEYNSGSLSLEVTA
jgi:hypothetical protein